MGEAIGKGVVIAFVGQRPYSQQAVQISKLVEKYLGIRNPKMFMEKFEQVHEVLGETSEHIKIINFGLSLGDGKTGSWFRSLTYEDKTTFNQVRLISTYIMTM